MIRRVLGAAVGMLLLAGGPAAATYPDGPRLALSVSTDGPGAEDEREEVITTDAEGENPRRLVGGPGALLGGDLSWSADGNRLAFGVSGVDSTATGPFGSGWQVVGVAEVDGAPTRVYPQAFLNAGVPAMAPDGRAVAFQRLKVVRTLPGRENLLFKSSIWLLDVKDGSARRSTPWRLASFLEPISYSSDGSSLLAVSVDRRGRRIVAVDLHSHRSRSLAPQGRDDWEPTFSPDGSRLAFVRLRHRHSSTLLPARPLSELLVARADGGGAQRVLRRKGYISSLSWDPSGSRLAFIRNPSAEATGALEPEPGNKVMAINADGTCLTGIFLDPEVTVHGVAWQPGPGREAGRIVC